MQLTGLAVLAIGIWLFVDPDILKLIDFVVSDESELFHAAAILLIALGAFVIIVSLLGFIGVIMERPVILGIVSRLPSALVLILRDSSQLQQNLQ